MALAYLYIRLSTDEQADKGFSQGDQEERLRNYRKTHNITRGKVKEILMTLISPMWEPYCFKMPTLVGKNKHEIK